MDTDDTSGCSSAVNLDLLLSKEYTHMYMRIADAACVQVIIFVNSSFCPSIPSFLLLPLYPTIHSFIHVF